MNDANGTTPKATDAARKRRAEQPLELAIEHGDVKTFSGSIFEQIKKKIDDAAVVIADLSGANANVYLELGYAIGKGIPTVQLVRDVKELKFDVQAERCLVYDSIRTLETKLTEELRVVKASMPKTSVPA